VTTSSPKQRRGVMLFEMLITIGLIAIFIALAGKLFTTTLRLTQTSDEASRTVAAYESALAALRRDAWGASEVVALPEQGGLRVTRGDGSAVTWSIDNDDDAMVRREGQSILRWPGVGAKASVHPDPAGILVRAGEDEIRLTSELLLARKGGTP
jgi:hypothetical protein